MSNFRIIKCLICLTPFIVGDALGQSSTLPSVSFSKTLKALGTDDPSYGEVSHNLALLYKSEGYFSLAKEAFLSSMQHYINTDSTDSEQYSYLIADFGDLYWEKGELTIARDLYRDSEKILSSNTGSLGERYVDLKINLGVADAILGNHLSAMVGFNQVRTLFERELLVQKSEIVKTIIRIADVYSEIENFQRAKSLYSEAEGQLSVLDNQNDKVKIQLLQRKAAFSKKNSSLMEAIDLQKEAVDLTISEYGEKTVEYGLAIADLGELYLQDHQTELAESIISDALKILEEKIGIYHRGYLETLGMLGDLYRSQNQISESSEIYNRVISEWIRQYKFLNPVMGVQEKTSYYLTISHLMDKYASLIETGLENNGEILSIFLNHELILNDIQMHPPIEINLSNEELVSWRNECERLLFLYRQPQSVIPGGISVLTKLEQKISSLEKKISKKNGVEIKRGHQSISSWRDLQKSLPDSSAAVEIVRFPWFSAKDISSPSNEVHYLFVSFDNTSEEPKGVFNKNGNEMENRYLTHYRNSINHKFSDDYAYEVYWLPVKEHFSEYSKIIVSPSGAYSQINLMTLKNLETGKYLIDEKSIDIVTSIVHQGLDSKIKDKSKNEVHIFGNPDYHLKDLDVEIDAKPYEIYTADQGESGMYYMRDEIRQQILWNELLYIDDLKSQEVDLLDELYKSTGFTTHTYINNDARESRLKGLNNPYTLHISTHGYFMEDDDLNASSYRDNQLLHSGLIFSGCFDYLDNKKTSLSGEDGLLTTYEIANLDLTQTELVFLSSCETGLGIVKNGNAISNLQHAFQEAGAKSLIMTLWTTEAEYQLEFMNLFYYHWLLEELPKKKAFDKSIKIMKDSYENPYYWGSFIFVGE